jgi:hypothetical protein
MMEGDYEHAEELCREVLVLAEQAGDRQDMSVTLGNLAACALLRDRLGDAIRSAREAARSALQAGDRDTPVDALHVAAAAYARAGEIGQAARLLSAAEAISSETGRVLESVERAIRDDTMSRVRVHLREPGVATAWAEGEQMTLEEVLAQLLAAAEGV